VSVVGPDLPEGAVRSTLTGGLAAVELGDGPRGTVLLVPGYTGSKEDFCPLLPHLAEPGFRCVAVDQRGQLDSPGPDDPAAYTVEALAHDLGAVLDDLERPHLVGHSFGGLVARAAVLERPSRVRSLTLLGSGPAGLTGPRIDALEAVRPLVVAGELERVADLSEAAAELDPRRAAIDPRTKRFLRARLLASGTTALLAMADALIGEPDRTDDLRAAGVPVLVLHGEHDDAWTPAQQAEMATRLGARHAVVPGAWHSPAAEDPEATAKELLAFYDALDD
jgi:pimeloyl-ACP methyl ester carboxylesterase